MHRIVTFIFLLAFYNVAISQQTYLDKRGNEQLWGPHDTAALLEEPYAKWYLESLKDYQPDLVMLNKIKELKKAKVTIYLGTWCGDSKDLVPKFLSIWDQIGLSEDQITMISLHSSLDMYKQGPNKEEHGQNIHRVPTIIFSKNDEEIGRIVERPLTSLECDLAQINHGTPSTPRYQGVAMLHDYFEHHMEVNGSYEDDLKMLTNKIRRNVMGSTELNTYGYVLKAANEHEKAKLVFLLNATIFEYDPNCNDSLGEIYMDLSEWDKAKECFRKVMSLKPNNDRAITKIYEINRALEEDQS